MLDDLVAEPVHLLLVGSLVVLALVTWGIVRTLRAEARRTATVRSQNPPPPRKSERPRKKPVSAPAPALPSFAMEDDIEVTVVEAMPATEPPPAEPVAAASASTVAVVYEDEADIEEATAPFARILVSAQGQSDRGQVRRKNEDSWLVLPDAAVFVVADGMGGYEGGDIASALAVETLRDSFERGAFDGKTEAKTAVPRRGRELACAVQMANQAILAHASTNPALAQMGTTLVGARFSPNKQRVYIANVGDSRCYRLRDKTLRQLTSDHTMAHLGYKGPGAHHLFQAVGIKPSILIDLIVDKPRPDDVYVLCTDGLTKMASNTQIRDILLLEPEIDSAVGTLIDLANDQGGKDNTTVILVKVVEQAVMLRRAGISSSPGALRS